MNPTQPFRRQSPSKKASKMISIIVAIDNHGVIGKENGLPWKLPGEMAFFKRTTTGHPIIMGRKTYDSIGRALPDRTNIVISRDSGARYPGCLSAASLDEAVELARKSPGADEIFVIGGESIYELALPITDRIYLTKVDANIENGDKFFRYDESQWEKTSSTGYQADDKNAHNYNIAVLQRRQR